MSPKLILLALPLLAGVLFAFRTAKKVTRVVFFGDSITQAGIYPGGYIAQMRDSLAAEGKAKRYDLIGAGIGGNKIYDLYLRLEEDVLARKPHVVVIYIGVNDVWHRQMFGTGTDADKFYQFYVALIKKFQQKGIRVLLCTPACIGEKHPGDNLLDGELNRFSDIVRQLSTENSLPLCDLRQAFLDHAALHNPDNLDSGLLTTDGVHLNEKGNQLVAKMLLETLTSMR